MGVIIFFTVVFVEILFATFSIITKSNHLTEKSILRIVSFIVFMLLVILSIIDFSFRYYALAFFLLLTSIIGVKTLVRGKKEKGEYKVVRVVLRTIGMSVLFFILILPAILFPQNKKIVDYTGQYQVKTKSYTYIDKNRLESYISTVENRKLNVKVWYPDNYKRRYPLIVFSHGGLGIKSSNESLYNELASHGYVVLSIDHTYQCFYTKDESGNTTFINFGYMKELLFENSLSDIQQSYKYYQKWMEIRTDDMDFVIDYVIGETKKDNTDMVYKLMDINKVGVMGHSLGGSAALGMGRIRDDIKAVIALESPYMYDIEGVENKEFIFTDMDYPIPVLNVYSDSAWAILAKRPQYEVNYRMLDEKIEDVFNVYIRGAGHLALTDFAITSPILTGILDGKNDSDKTLYYLKTINMVSLEFFNSYLKSEGDFTLSGSY